jgi:hypothetical protein
MSSKRKGIVVADDETTLFAPENAAIISTIGVCCPFVVMCIAHSYGLSGKLFGALYRNFGPVGLLGLPSVSIVIEKSIYDTLNSFCGTDPCVHSGSYPKTYPSGGYLLPSFSLVEVRKRKEKQQVDEQPD